MFYPHHVASIIQSAFAPNRNRLGEIGPARIECDCVRVAITAYAKHVRAIGLSDENVAARTSGRTGVEAISRRWIVEAASSVVKSSSSRQSSIGLAVHSGPGCTAHRAINSSDPDWSDIRIAIGNGGTAAYRRPVGNTEHSNSIWTSPEANHATRSTPAYWRTWRY